MGNVKLEGRDIAACSNLMSCLGNVKNCRALIEAFAVELNLEASTALESEPNCTVEEQKLMNLKAGSETCGRASDLCPATGWGMRSNCLTET